jgi:hypothetical protein
MPQPQSDTETVTLTVTPKHRPVFQFEYELNEGETPAEAKERVREDGVIYEEADIALMDVDIEWAEPDDPTQLDGQTPLLVDKADIHDIIDLLEHNGYDVTETEIGFFITHEEDTE